MARIPESIDKYKIEELIASGGMGRVYRGVHPTLERPVIIKKLTLRGEAAYAERFRREASILMDFRSDYVVDVYDHFRKGGNHYIVMEYVDGRSVQEILQQERYLDSALCAYIALCTAKALAYAHGKNVVHRDIKPANVLVSRDGEVKLADFGIATSREIASDLTSEGMTLGTPSYMAPEQFADSRTVDGRADFYSLGVMLYEMLTGHKPFPGRFSPELIRTIESGRYKNPRRINPAVPAELARIIRMVLRPDPRKRKADPDEIIPRLERFLGQFDESAVKARLAATVAEAELAPLTRKKRRRRSARLAIAGAAVVAAGALAGWSLLTGLHHRVFAPATHGQVRFVVEGFPGEVAPGELEVHLAAADSEHRSDRGHHVPVAPMVDRLPRDPASVIVTTLPRVLPVGEYRATALMGSREVVALFTVEPWGESRSESIIVLPVVEPPPRELRMEAQITDADTGAALTETALIEVLRGARYVPLRFAGNLYSGRVLTVRIRVPGYQTRTLVVEPARDVGSLTIRAAMNPVQ